jgi:hypothetical protein
MKFFMAQEETMEKTRLIGILKDEIEACKSEIKTYEKNIKKNLTQFEQITSHFIFRLVTALLAFILAAIFFIETVNAFTCTSSSLNCTPVRREIANILVPTLLVSFLCCGLCFWFSYAQQKRLAPQIQEANELKRCIYEDEEAIPEIELDIQKLEVWGRMRAYIAQKVMEKGFEFSPKALKHIDAKISSEGVSSEESSALELINNQIGYIYTRYPDISKMKLCKLEDDESLLSGDTSNNLIM